MSAATPEMLAALRKMLTKDQGGLALFPMGDPLLYPSNHGDFLFFNPSLNNIQKHVSLFSSSYKEEHIFGTPCTISFEATIRGFSFLTFSAS